MVRRPSFRIGCLGGLVFCLAVTVGVFALLAPWAFHMGGRFTPLGNWSGYGLLRTSTGLQYPIYLYFGPGFNRRSRLTRAVALSGSAWVCPSAGVTQRMKLSGDIYNPWSGTAGSRVVLYFLEPVVLNVGQRRRAFSLSGAWRGPDLVLTDGGSWTSRFLRIRRAETASVTLSWGGYSEFRSACQALK